MSFASFMSRWLRRYSPQQQKRRPFVRPKPGVEYLEDRTLLNVGVIHVARPSAFYIPPNITGEHLVTGLYYDVLQRQPAQWEVTYWTKLVDGTAANREVIAQ